jgi:hypothetical protein
VIPFDQTKTRVVIENHLCFAVLKYCVHSPPLSPAATLTGRGQLVPVSWVARRPLLGSKPLLRLLDRRRDPNSRFHKDGRLLRGLFLAPGRTLSHFARNREFESTPLQRGVCELSVPRGARRAIRYGDGWIPGGDIREVLPKFREMAREAGRDPAAIEITSFALGEDLDRVMRLNEMDAVPSSKGSTNFRSLNDFRSRVRQPIWPGCVGSQPGGGLTPQSGFPDGSAFQNMILSK